MFHAKDDADIVRREVFKTIKKFSFSFQAVVRRKAAILNSIKEQYQIHGLKTFINEKEIYNSMVARLFRNLLHKSDCRIIFAERGNTFSDTSLKDAIGKAKRNLHIKYNIINVMNTEIVKSQPSKHIGLQIADYYLWTLKKVFENNDISFFDLLRDDFKLIIDCDDKRRTPYGEYYSGNNELTIEKIKEAN